MGRSVKKWFKTLLLGKNSTKSSLSKNRDAVISAYDDEPFISSPIPLTDSTVDPTLKSTMVSKTRIRSAVELDKVAAEILPKNADAASDNQPLCLSQAPIEDPGRVGHQQAATMIQAAFRGHLARCTFRTLKGIVRLQGLIRGYLVRRQAVATLYCVQNIAKLQALIRNQKGSTEPKHLVFEQKLLKNAFIQRLLVAPTSAMPLHFQYGPEDTNSAWEWLQRWTWTCFQKPLSQPKKSLLLKCQLKHQMVEIEKGRPKQIGYKQLGTNIETRSDHSKSEYDKSKHSTGKLPAHVTHSDRENSKNDIEKVKSGLLKTQDTTKESQHVEVHSSRSKHQGHGLGYVASDVLEEDASDSARVVKDRDVKITLEPEPKNGLKVEALEDTLTEPHEQCIPSFHLVESSIKKDDNLNLKDGITNSEDQERSKRRASFPVMVGQQQNRVPGVRKLPSYMAPTESAKAKLRGQGSPRFIEDEVRKSGMKRRSSLPSLTNGKASSFSTCAERLVGEYGIGLIRSDKSLTASRDLGGKGIKEDRRN